MASITCPNCQTVLAAGTPTCPSCGNPQSGVTSTAAATPTGAKPQIKFDFASLNSVDRLVGGGSAVLFISLFLTWFSYAGFGISGLTAHGYLYIVLILSLAIIGLIAVEALGIWTLPASSALSREQLFLVGTAINFVLVLIAFLLKPGGYGFHGVGWSYGAFVGLIAAVVAAFPLGWPVIQARRAKK